MSPVEAVFVGFTALVFSVSCGEKKESSRPTDQQAAPSSEASEKTAEPAAEDSKEPPQEKKSLASPESRKMVLVVVDTLRADRLGCYGYEDQPTTPAIDQIASQGVLFESFRSSSPWTAPSFGTLFTGVAPTVHGAGQVLRGSSDSGKEVLGVRVSPLGRGLPTLAELLGDVSTAAIVNNSFLHESLGYSRGFDHYDHYNSGLSRLRRADEVNEKAFAWLEEHKDEDFFLLVHYFDPHIAYDPPKEYVKRFASGPRGRMRVPFTQHSAARKGTLDPSDKEKAFIIGLYNGEVRFVDDQIARLVDKMKKLGVFDESWFIVTSDHGEEQFDHGSFDHGHRYEDEVTRVPLVIRAPGGEWQAGSRVPYSARYIDLVPTILELFAAKVPEHLPGRSLMPLISGKEEEHRPAFMEYNLYWKQRHALFDGRYKLIRDVVGDRGYLYDLKEDPEEQNKLGKEHPAYGGLEKQLLGIKKELEELEASVNGKDDSVEIPDEVLKSLKSLGYIE